MSANDQKTSDHFEALCRARRGGATEGRPEFTRAYAHALAQIKAEREAPREDIGLEAQRRCTVRGVFIGAPSYLTIYGAELGALRQERERAAEAAKRSATRAAAARPEVSRQTPASRTATVTPIRASEAARKTTPVVRITAEDPDTRDLRAAVSVLRCINSQSLTKEQATAYQTFLRHKPMHLRGGYALIVAIADVSNGRMDPSAIQRAADAVLAGLRSPHRPEAA